MPKRAMIFLHGGPGFKDYLEPYFSGLESDFKCIFYNQKRGEKVSIDDLITELDSIVEEQLESPILLGHSWGGVLGTEYVKRHREKVSGLVLMSTGLSSKQWVQWNDEIDAVGLEDAPPEKLFLTPIEQVDGKKLLDKTMKSFSRETFGSLFESYLKKYNLLGDLANIRIPIINIYGEKDLRFSKNITTTFKKYNCAINNIEIPNAGHFPFLDENNRNIIVKSIIENFK